MDALAPAQHPIPDTLLDQRQAFVGTSGSGKTYAAGTEVERLLQKRHRVVISDPLGVWWGLRLQPDGKTPSPFDVVLFGGKHADLPITATSGRLIGETVATMSESAIVALDSLSSATARRRFMLDFLDAIYEATDPAKVEPYHLVLDEADLWAPQKPVENDHKLLQSRTEEIVRRGRVKGFIPWLITQRPAVLSKDVLSQADMLVAMKLTSSQDRNAIKGWIEGQADLEEAKGILAALPKMQTGQGVVWAPGAGILDTVEFPAKVTFDSSRTPKRGERRIKATVQPLDLPALKERMAKVDAEAKANDPATLRKEIAELKAAAKKTPAADPAAIEAAEKRGYERGYKQGSADEWARGASAIRAEVVRLQQSAESVAGDAQAVVRALRALRYSIDKIAKDAGMENPPLAASNPARAATSSAQPPKRAVASIPNTGGSASEFPGTVSGVGLRILGALRELEVMGVAKAPRAMVAFLAGYSNLNSKGFVNGIGALRSGALIEYPDAGTIGLTNEGRAAAPEPAYEPTTEAIRQRIVELLGGPSARILDPLIKAWPASLTRAEVAAEAGYGHLNSKGFVNAIGRLRTLGFIDYPASGEVRATELLFPTTGA